MDKGEEQEDSGGSVIPSQKCPHIFSSALDRDGFLSDSSLVETFKEPCDICQDSNENWICLSCRMPVCSRFVNGHAEEHWIDTLMYSGGEPTSLTYRIIPLQPHLLILFPPHPLQVQISILWSYQHEISVSGAMPVVVMSNTIICYQYLCEPKQPNSMNPKSWHD